MPEALANPFAPPCDNGFNDASPQGFVDVDFTYPYDVSLTGLQVLTGQQVSTTNDADFVIRAMVVSLMTGTFKIKIYDSQNYSLSNDYIQSGNLLGDASSPFPIFPEILIPAGGRIGIDIADTSGSTNAVEI
jgi:hypothetical protein